MKKDKERDEGKKMEKKVLSKKVEEAQEPQESEDTDIGQCSEKSGKNSKREVETVSMEEYAKIESEKTALKDQLLRLAAEFDNYKKRAKKDLEEIKKYGNEDIVKSLIPVMDDVVRFFCSVSDEDLKDEKVSKLFSGVKMVLDTLEKKLKESGLEKYSLLHKPFDPHYSDAVMQQESLEHENGIVINEFEPAYVLNGRVVRHGKVIVAKNESQK